jgi:hypothetical protein
MQRGSGHVQGIAPRVECQDLYNKLSMESLLLRFMIMISVSCLNNSSSYIVLTVSKKSSSSVLVLRILLSKLQFFLLSKLQFFKLVELREWFIDCESADRFCGDLSSSIEKCASILSSASRIMLSTPKLKPVISDWLCSHPSLGLCLDCK